MKAVVHRGVRTLEIESRVAEAPTGEKEWGGRGVNAIAPACLAAGETEPLRADPQHNQAMLGRIPAGRRRDADDLTGAAMFPASSASDYGNGIVGSVGGGWPGR